jgi:LDH2 family malate/lactate/ureidoglycolate dehydrogenase
MSTGNGITVAAGKLAALVTRLFVAAGVAERSADRVANALVDADLEGQPSHGVMLVDMYLNRIRHGSVSLEQSGQVISDQDAAVVLDARHALGHLVGDQAMSLAVERARRHAVGVVAVRHGFHFGTARRFALQAAHADCVGIAMCNTRPLMPAPGGAERLVGNNPIAIAIPADGPVPIVLDMATSEAAMGKIRMAAKDGQAIPDNWAVKADGSPTADPVEAISGMLLPSGGPKGFGLALVIDLMCGLLSGGASGKDVRPLYGDPAVPYDSSHLFIAIDLAHFGDAAAMRAKAAAAAARIREGKTAPGVKQLFAPGELEWRKRQAAGGQVTLTAPVAGMLVQMAKDLGVPPDPLPIDLASTKEIGHAQA